VLRKVIGKDVDGDMAALPHGYCGPNRCCVNKEYVDDFIDPGYGVIKQIPQPNQQNHHCKKRKETKTDQHLEKTGQPMVKPLHGLMTLPAATSRAFCISLKVKIPLFSKY